jgi:prepilin-type N-terminal cleavage/methylation domain-containing protein
MKRHPRKIVRRRGLSLLEVVLALAILSGAFASLTQLVSTGLRAAANARDLTRAQIMAETVVSEIVAGVTPAAPITQAELEPGWLVSINVVPTVQDGVIQLVVGVERVNESRQSVRYEITRWLRDPDLPLPTDDAEAAADTGSSSTAGGTSSSSTPSTSGAAASGNTGAGR